MNISQSLSGAENFMRLPCYGLTIHRTLPTSEIMETVANKLRGHYAYYGITGNSQSIGVYFYQVK